MLINSSSPDQNGRHFADYFSNAFSSMKHFMLRFKIHWSLFLKVQLTITQHWFSQWFGAEYATSHYLNQCWSDSLKHIRSTKGRWVEGAMSSIFDHAISHQSSRIELRYCVLKFILQYIMLSWTSIFNFIFAYTWTVETNILLNLQLIVPIGCKDLMIPATEQSIMARVSYAQKI